MIKACCETITGMVNNTSNSSDVYIKGFTDSHSEINDKFADKQALRTTSTSKRQSSITTPGSTAGTTRILRYC